MDCANALVWTHYGRLAVPPGAGQQRQDWIGSRQAGRAAADESAAAVVRSRERSVDGGRADVSRLQSAFALVYVLVSQWPDWDHATMMRIGACESGLQNIRSHDVNDDGLYDWGVFQNHGDPASLDPVVGAAHAYEKWVAAREAGGTGYEPWQSSIGCWG
jgi:hypothetical protein